jgi:hypothetical protein
MKLAIVIPALLLAAPLFGQTKIFVDAVDTETEPIRTELIRLIDASPKLTLVSDTSYDVEIDVTCLETHPSRGYACSHVVTYNTIGIPYNLTSGVGIGPTAEVLAHDIFSSLCEHITPDRLKRAEESTVATWQAIVKTQKDWDSPAAKKQKNDGTLTPDTHKRT